MIGRESGGPGSYVDRSSHWASEQRWVVQLGLALTVFVVALECFRYWVAVPQVQANSAPGPEPEAGTLREQVDRLKAAVLVQERQLEALTANAGEITTAAKKLEGMIKDPPSTANSGAPPNLDPIVTTINGTLEKQTKVLDDTSKLLERFQEHFERVASWQVEEADVIVVAFNSYDMQMADYKEAYRNAILQTPARDWSGHRIGLTVVHGTVLTPVLPLAARTRGDARKMLQAIEDAGAILDNVQHVAREISAVPADVGENVRGLIRRGHEKSTRFVLVVSSSSAVPPVGSWPDMKADVLLVKTGTLQAEKLGDWSQFVVDHDGLLAPVYPAPEPVKPAPEPAKNTAENKPNAGAGNPQSKQESQKGVPAKKDNSKGVDKKAALPAAVPAEPNAAQDKNPAPDPTKGLRDGLEQALRRLTQPGWSSGSRGSG
jgi:hypothetical protein